MHDHITHPGDTSEPAVAPAGATRAGEPLSALADQFAAERRVFDGLARAIKGAAGLGLIPGEPGGAEPVGGAPPLNVRPGEVWFWFAGHHRRLRHAFRPLGGGTFLSSIKLESPLAPADEGLSEGSSYELLFDRFGTVKWPNGACDGRTLGGDPLGILSDLILSRWPSGGTDVVLDSLKGVQKAGR